jgi:hypothetical protein
MLNKYVRDYFLNRMTCSIRNTTRRDNPSKMWYRNWDSAVPKCGTKQCISSSLAGVYVWNGSTAGCYIVWQKREPLRQSDDNTPLDSTLQISRKKVTGIVFSTSGYPAVKKFRFWPRRWGANVVAKKTRELWWPSSITTGRPANLTSCDQGVTCTWMGSLSTLETEKCAPIMDSVDKPLRVSTVL